MPDRISRLSNAGVHLHADSHRLVDWAEQPPWLPHPYGPTADRSHHEFTQRDDEAILLWLSVTEEAGVTGGKVFDELSTLKPQHSPAALASRAARLAKKHAPPSLTPLEVLENPFSGLDRAEDLVDSSNEAAEEVSDLPHGLTYSDFRMDIQKSVVRLLALEDGDCIEDFLRQPWVSAAFQEYRDSAQDDLLRQDGSVDEEKDGPGSSQHAWKIKKAETSISSRSKKYIGDEVDKTAWTPEDHQIRFMVRVAIEAAAHEYWHSGPSTSPPWTILCTRSLWLLNWIRFIYKTGRGKSADAMRILKRKQEWVAVLKSSVDRLSGMDYRTAWAVDTERTEDSDSTDGSMYTAVSDLDTVHQPDTHSSTETQTCEPQRGQNDPAVQTPALQRPPGSPPTIPIPQYTMPASRNKEQQKGASWLTQQVRTVFHNNLRRRLNAWGVTERHRGTCILVPQEWANAEPLEVMGRFSLDAVPTTEPCASRLGVSIEDVDVTFGRAVAWFSHWPRRGVELDQFLAAQSEDCPWQQMQGSHLCHHGFCINPNHIVWESTWINFSRGICITTARHFRAYGDVRTHCNVHDPPCLLQHAALTTYEVFCIQMYVLRLANGLPVSDHQPEMPPSDYRRPTSEVKLPLEMGCHGGQCIVTVDQDDLVGGSSQASTDTIVEPFFTDCSLCDNVRRWTRITAYWAHLKNRHDDVPRATRLEMIRKSALDHQHRARNSIGATWSMIEQALAPGFTWETVEGWRLAKDATYSKGQS